jgi:hypothetical protein
LVEVPAEIDQLLPCQSPTIIFYGIVNRAGILWQLFYAVMNASCINMSKTTVLKEQG